MTGVDRKIAFASAPAVMPASGHSGTIRDYMPRQVKNPKVTSMYQVSVA